MRIGLALLSLACTISCTQVTPPEVVEEPDEQAASNVKSERNPNFLIVVADDLGWSDIGAFGGEIRTPVLDELAASGLLMTNFYVAPTCSPTRAMLMTGVGHHQAGVGTMTGIAAPNQTTRNYAAQLHEDVVTFAEALNANGYQTLMSGKWHLAVDEEQRPHKRGFDRSFALLPGGASHFADQLPLGPGEPPEYVEDGAPAELPEDFYSSISYTDKMLQFLEERETDQPFLAYLAYTAPHDPLQVPEDWLDRYDGQYDDGPYEVRRSRVQRQIERGLIPEDTKLWEIPNFPPWLPLHMTPWETRSADQKAHDTRPMEIYAAMVELMDQQLGRVIEKLDADGELENTYFVFFSDNGASAIAPLMYPGSSEAWFNETWNRNMENAGRPQNFTVQGREWASASNAPLRLAKGSVAEGGIRSPLIVAGPSIPNGGVSNALAHVMDIAPTIYDLAGIDPVTDATFEGTLEMQGTSLLPAWRLEQDSVRDGFMTELFNARAGRDGKWKIANLPRPLGTGQWELYDLSVDPGETNNLAGEHPEILQELVAQYEAFAADNGVIPPIPPPTQTPRRMYPYVCDDACEAAFERFMAMQPPPGVKPTHDSNQQP